MLKRRNSPYASHDWHAPRRVPMDCTPVMLGPGRITRPRGGEKDDPTMWSSATPTGGFVI
jgi:hypothetical protein